MIKVLDGEMEFEPLDPDDMPRFLNSIACDYFADQPEIKWKLAQCSFWIHMINEIRKMNR
jgi:hypothetical protein